MFSSSTTAKAPQMTAQRADNSRAFACEGKGATLYYPVSVEGALVSAADTHTAQGDSELCGTAIESSWTGVFQILLHKRNDLDGTILSHPNWPLLETSDQWVVHGFSFSDYLNQLGPNAQEEIFKKLSVGPVNINIGREAPATHLT
jgi:Acetamidase/Formamidase family